MGGRIAGQGKGGECSVGRGWGRNEVRKEKGEKTRLRGMSGVI